MFAVVLAMFATQAALADTLHYQALLDGLQEAPVPNASPASGMATGLLDLATNTLCIHLEFSGLTAPQTAAHVHNAPPGVAGPVFLPLTFGSPSDTCGVISDAREADVVAGNSYVNVHSNNFPGGEIRGQLNKVPEPTTLALLSLGFAFIRRRRR